MIYDLDALWKLEFTAEQIQNVCYNWGTLNEEVILENSTNKDENLIKFGLLEFKPEIFKCAKDIAYILKTKGFNDKSKDEIKDRFTKFINQIPINLKRVCKDFEDKTSGLDKQKLAMSIWLVSVIICLGVLLENLFKILFGPIIADNLSSIVVAPLTEELGKIISIKGKFDKEYFVVFNIIEFTGFSLGHSFKQYIVRAICVGAHGAWTLIHKLFDSKEFRRKLGLKDNKQTEIICTISSYIITCVLHGLWNYSETNPIKLVLTHYNRK